MTMEGYSHSGWINFSRYYTYYNGGVRDIVIVAGLTSVGIIHTIMVVLGI